MIHAADPRASAQPRTVDNATFTYADTHALVRRLAGLSVAKRRALPGLEAARADIILAGAIIVEQAMSTFGIDEMVVSGYALREGALLDAFQRTHGAALHHLHDLRRRSVVRLAEMMDEEPAHSAHAARLALMLFDETASLHGLGDDARELLEAAALLANVGLFVSHSKHHKHTLLRDPELRPPVRLHRPRDRDDRAGRPLPPQERAVGQARRVRRAAPRDQEAVRTMAGILRVAIGLDRTHAGHVTGLRAHTRRRTLVIEVDHDEGADISLELYTANERRELLEAGARPAGRGGAPREPRQPGLSSGPELAPAT